MSKHKVSSPNKQFESWERSCLKIRSAMATSIESSGNQPIVAASDEETRSSSAVTQDTARVHDVQK